MKVRFYHAKAYDWETIKPGEATETDFLATNARGERTRRISIDSPYTETTFSGGSINAIHDEREAAGLAKKSDISIMARHIEDAVIPSHFDIKDLTGISCDDPVIEKSLQTYFGVGGKENSND